MKEIIIIVIIVSEHYYYYDVEDISVLVEHSVTNLDFTSHGLYIQMMKTQYFLFSLSYFLDSVDYITSVCLLKILSDYISVWAKVCNKKMINECTIENISKNLGIENIYIYKKVHISEIICFGARIENYLTLRVLQVATPVGPRSLKKPHDCSVVYSRSAWSVLTSAGHPSGVHICDGCHNVIRESPPNCVGKVMAATVLLEDRDNCKYKKSYFRLDSIEIDLDLKSIKWYCERNNYYCNYCE